MSHTGSAWWADELNQNGNHDGKYWMHLGGDWVSLEELGATSELGPVLKAGLGNVSVVTGDPLAGDFDVWVITHPVSD